VFPKTAVGQNLASSVQNSLLENGRSTSPLQKIRFDTSSIEPECLPDHLALKRDYSGNPVI